MFHTNTCQVRVMYSWSYFSDFRIMMSIPRDHTMHLSLHDSANEIEATENTKFVTLDLIILEKNTFFMHLFTLLIKINNLFTF